MTERKDIVILNIVATTSICRSLYLVSVLKALDEGATYEPETFPGLVYRIMDPKVVALLFCSGKVVCTGAKRNEDLHLAMGRIQTELTAVGML